MPSKLSDDAVSSIVKSTPSGVWIWQLDKIDKNYLAKLSAIRCGRVYLKVFDDYHGGGLLKQVQSIPDFRKAGITVVGWGYHFNQHEDINAVEEAAAVAEAIKFGLDGYIADLEKEVGFSHVFPIVLDLLVRLREAVGEKFLGYSSFGHPGFHPEMPWRIFDENTDFAFPQIYFEKWRGARWGKDDEDRVQLALKAHEDLGLKNPILPIWGSEEDTQRPATVADLQPYLARFPGSSVFRIPHVGQQGVAWALDYSASRLAVLSNPLPAFPTHVVPQAAIVSASGSNTREQMTLVAMRISGRFEGDDPWANITGNFDGQGLTCGMLGKTFRDGDQQRVIRLYLDQFGPSELFTLMPQSGRKYLQLCSLVPAQGAREISHWSVNGNSERLLQPYFAELQRFWKSPKMVSIQFQAALNNEARFAEQHSEVWKFGRSLHAFCFFFDIATQNGSLKGLGPEDVQKFHANHGSSLDACNFICTRCQGAENSRSNAFDAHRNGQLWKELIGAADDISRQLFTLGWLRSQLALATYVFTVMNRRGTLALSRGFVDKAAWDFQEDFGLLAQASPAPIAVPVILSSADSSFQSPAAPTTSILPSRGPADGQTMKVAVTSLNLRSAPNSSTRTNILVSLPNGQLVQVIDSSRADDWWRVSVNFRGTSIQGYVSSKFLSDCNSASADPSNALVAVHLAPTARLSKPADAHPLGEPTAPQRQGATPEACCADLARIISFLDVAHSRRYVPTASTTFCNIYAYDYCYLARVYLPRVWWLDSAIQKLSQHQSVIPEFGKTVDEIRANELEVWFDQFGRQFGWQHTLDPNDLQTAANQGGVGIIVARNRIDLRSGHIVAVPPETAEYKTQRSPSGIVSVPLQSQAGRVNFSYGMGSKGTRWWTDQTRFRAFGLWFHM